MLSHGFLQLQGQLSSSFIHGITVWSSYSCLFDGSEFLLSSQGWPAVTHVLNSTPSTTAIFCAAARVNSDFLVVLLSLQDEPSSRGVLCESLWGTRILTVSPGWISIVLGASKKSVWTLGESYRLESYNFINWIFPSCLFYPTRCPKAAILEKTQTVLAKVYPPTYYLPLTI